MTIQPVFPKRRRCGQPGNTNAVKYSFYAKQFKRTKIKDLDQTEKIGLQDEINMLRVFIRRVVEKAGSGTTVWEDIEILRCLSVAFSCLDRLTRTQRLSPDDKELDLFQHAILKVNQDVGLLVFRQT